MKKEIYNHFQQPEIIAKMVTETIKEVQNRKKSFLSEVSRWQAFPKNTQGKSFYEIFQENPDIFKDFVGGCLDTYSEEMGEIADAVIDEECNASFGISIIDILNHPEDMFNAFWGELIEKGFTEEATLDRIDGIFDLKHTTVQDIFIPEERFTAVVMEAITPQQPRGTGSLNFKPILEKNFDSFWTAYDFHEEASIFTTEKGYQCRYLVIRRQEKHNGEWTATQEVHNSQHILHQMMKDGEID